MAAILEKTLLSTRPKKGSLIKSLYALSALMLVFAMDQQDLFNLPGSLSATHAQVFGHHEYWRAFTTVLIHADLGHLASNSLFFTGLGYLLGGYFGGWVFPVLSFIAGGLANLIVLSTYPDHVTLVGASGVVYFMAAFWLTLYFFVQRGLSPIRRVVNALGLAFILLVPELAEAHVSYLTHAVGFALGLPMGAAYFILNRANIRSYEVWREPVKSESDFALSPELTSWLESDFIIEKCEQGDECEQSSA